MLMADTPHDQQRHDEPAVVNIGAQLNQAAREWPTQIAVVEPRGREADGRRRYRQVTFRELDQDSDQIAGALRSWGVTAGQRLVLMVRPGIDFISLTFALFKAGVVIVLIDPGMGQEHLLRCLQEVDPDGFVALPLVQAIRCLKRRLFPRARFNVTVGRRYFWGGKSLAEIRGSPVAPFSIEPTAADDSAAIIFTTGSTGPPKGVHYRHGNFAHQVTQIRDHYRILPGEVDLPGFPLFGLFNAAMGVTTVVPDMDPTRPARVDPRLVVEAVHDWKVTQAFGSPAIWNVVGKYCEETGTRLPSIRRLLSAGAPVPPHVVQRVKKAIAPDGEIHTPYGATESLPVASISGTEILTETAARTAAGGGTCVGRRFSEIQWKIMAITDEPIRAMRDLCEEPRGEIGELLVTGPVVTRDYVTRIEANALAKVVDDVTGQVWHRMGDVGYLDDVDRFWFCGRKAHRVRTSRGTMYTIPCEAIANQHPHIYRSALVGIGPPGEQSPVIVVEPWPAHLPRREASRRQLLDEVFARLQQSVLTESIRREHLLCHASLPVDIRHNAKIFREKLAIWAQQQLEAR